MKALLFPGQGAQTVGMGQALVQESEAARRVFARADACLGYSLSALCFEGPAEELTRTDRAQPAIYVTSVASVEAARERGDDPAEVRAAAGLSLGEYTACWFAGAFSFEDGLRLVQRRGSAMQAACEAHPSSMVSLLGVDASLAEQACDAVREGEVLVVANLNSPGQVVVSGSRSACARLVERGKELGIRRAVPLNVAGAFHSPLMESARQDLAQALTDTPMEEPRIPVYSNVTAGPVRSAEAVRDLLSRQVVSPVRWAESMEAMWADGFTQFVEPAPGTALAGLMKKTLPDAVVTPWA